jgi:hypothetical protein
VTVPTLLILGTDVVLAAQPATPVQLWHACLAAGYHAVIPSTWGDELIAARTVEHLRLADGPLVQCSCPLVARRLAAHGASIEPMLLSLVPPPVATAEYLRALYAPRRIHITFAGACPAGAHQSIDEWLSPDDLVRVLGERGISVGTQPREFDSTLPPDRRRFYSEPGGLPARSVLQHLSSPIELHELGADDLVAEVAQRLLSGTRSLLDVAPALDCRCSGKLENVRIEEARSGVRLLEPPRAFAPVVDHSVAVALDGALSLDAALSDAAFDKQSLAVANGRESPPAMTDDMVFRPTPPSLETVSESMHPAPVLSRATVDTPARRVTPGQSRPVLGAMPLARTEAGRQLPRAYVARRRSSPRGLRQSTLRRVEPATSEVDAPQSRRWILFTAAGLGGGLIIAWLLRWI